jgi:NAD(P)-dependent dehydrogenase (short-subunit alcohol dehydrogenase family)
MKEFLIMDDKFLDGKGALITGGASGFGKGVARAFAERGAKLALIDVNEELLEQTSKEIKDQYKVKVIPIVCDVSNSDQVEAMAKQAYKELENIFFLFNNAGIGVSYGRNICRVKEADWDKIMAVNLKGQWLVARSLWRKMKSQQYENEELSGKMVNTASAAGIVVDPAIPAYSLTKVGVIALTQLLAKTLAPNVTVNSIAPGFHVTGIYLNDEESMRVTMRDGNLKIPQQRIGTVEDIVNMVLFLASPASNYITGHCFPVDGGMSEVGVPPHKLKEIEY